MTEALLRRLGRDQWVRVHGTPRITVLAGGDEARRLWERWVSVANIPNELLVGEPDRCMRDALAVALREPARPVAVHGSIASLEGWRRGRSDRLAAMYDEGVIRLDEDAQPLDARPTARHETRDRDASATPLRAPDAQPTLRAPAAIARDEVAALQIYQPDAPPPTPRAPDAQPTRLLRAPDAIARDEVAAPQARQPDARLPDARLPDTRQPDARLPDAPQPDARAAALDETTRGQLFDARSAAEAALYVALEATPATRGKFDVNGRLAVRFGPTAAEVDLIARAEGIAIEIDGYHHFTDAESYRRDRRKDLLLQMQGLIVIRVLAEDVVRDARAAIDHVCQALAYRLGEQR